MNVVDKTISLLRTSTNSSYYRTLWFLKICHCR